MTEPIAVPRPSKRIVLATFAAPINAMLAYLGGLGANVLSAPGVFGSRPSGTLGLRESTLRQLDWLLGAGLPIVGLLHIGMGSFLAMQAYFGATFDLGVGPVVGVGLIRNGAPLLSGFVVAGLLAARATVELRTTPRVDVDADPSWIADRAVVLGEAEDQRQGPCNGRILLPRLMASMLAGPVLGLGGAAVGTLIGYRVANSVLGIPIEMLLHSFAEMLWLRDVAGLVVKGVVFGAVAAAVASYEGTREDSTPTPVAAARACCLAMALILGLNLSWFFFVYLAGPPFGPTVLPT